MTKKFILSQEDGTVEGGNTRGNGSVDLQMSRTSNGQVASNNFSFIGGGRNNTVNAGYGSNEGSVIVGGVGNTNTANYAFIGGGSGNSLSGNDNLQVIVGGSSNSINASGGAFIGGGSSNSIAGGGTGYQVIAGGRSNVGGSTYTVISGGQLNTANSGSHATVVGGQSNTSSGTWSVSGGLSNTASGSRSVAMGGGSQATSNYAIAIGDTVRARNTGAVAIGGQSNNADGLRSVVMGFANQVSGNYSLAQGTSLNSYLRGQIVFGATNIVNTFSGLEQHSQILASKLDTLNSAATTVLSLDGTGVTDLIIPYGNNRAWNVKVETIATVTSITGTTDGVSVGDSLMQDDTLLFTRVGGTSSVVGVNNTNIIASTSMGTAGMSFTAGASQELALTFTAPTFTGGGSVTCRVVSKVSLVEVAW